MSTESSIKENIRMEKKRVLASFITAMRLLLTRENLKTGFLTVQGQPISIIRL